MNPQEFDQGLAEAEVKCQSIGKQFPEDPMIKSILAQLAFVKRWNEEGMNWNEPKLGELNFGLLASKSIDEEDRELAQLLYRLVNHIDDGRRK